MIALGISSNVLCSSSMGLADAEKIPAILIVKKAEIIFIIFVINALP